MSPLGLRVSSIHQTPGGQSPSSSSPRVGEATRGAYGLLSCSAGSAEHGNYQVTYMADSTSGIYASQAFVTKYTNYRVDSPLDGGKYVEYIDSKEMKQ